MCLKDMNRLHGVLGLSLGVGHLNVIHSIDDHLGEEVGLCSEKFRAHGRLCCIDDRVICKSVSLDGARSLDERDRLSESKTET